MDNQNKSKMEAKIAARYNNLALVKRKNITFNIDEELLERLDSAVSVFNQKDGSTTRNAVLEEAVSLYIESAEDYFEKENLNNDTRIVSVTDYDTAVFPAINDNFIKVFIGEHKWYHVRMAEHRVNNVKYVALYRGAPISAITHYAEVIDISDPIKEKEYKREIKLKEPIELLNHIPLGNIHVNSVRKLIYVSLAKLESAKTTDDLQPR